MSRRLSLSTSRDGSSLANIGGGSMSNFDHSNGGSSSPVQTPTSAASSSEASSNVQVVLRIRPVNNHDLTSIPPRFQRIAIHPSPGSQTSVSVDHATASLNASTYHSSSSKKGQVFHYDRVLGPDEGQEDLYAAAAEKLVGKFMEGFNVTILAYGQTSSGKSYSMGTALDSSSSSSPDLDSKSGIVPRAVADIFRRCEEIKRSSGGNVTFEAKNSFVELYNEDLLDLLVPQDTFAPTMGSERPTLSIREDKDGRILWTGLKEPIVRSKEEVMANLRAGTALRRTNETDMNAQSSRSHAIFSITLTQRRRVGSQQQPQPPGTPTSSAPPSSFIASGLPQTPGGGRGIPRPSSIQYNRTSTISPTPGSRPTTPSSGIAQRLRPPSVGSRASLSSLSNTEDEDDSLSKKSGESSSGNWITVTSKFHFVDLAGSERLKRTSALGERMKEGISINSGLLALGNVISALGDPTKVRASTHVPYRDSKLTRLLQDSLGGNAHTLMLACVSPAEFNITETLSTIKYANRARNIKNRAEVNEQEVGWDDVEHLQASLLKLRKEYALLKTGSNLNASIPTQELGSIREERGGSSAAARLMIQLSELQAKHADLSDQYSSTTVEVARLRRQVEESKGSEMDGRGFAEMVQPVIEEYEKAIASLEAELTLSRAALSHTSELYTEQEAQLTEVTNRNASNETYVQELRSRVTKLVEREASTEIYIRDLEVKLKGLSEKDESNGSQVSELRKELARMKDVEVHSGKYIADLEARLTKSDESRSSIAEHVDRLEKEVSRREDMYKELEARLVLVDTTNDNKVLLQELDEKDNKVADLERKLENAVRENGQLGQERERLKEEVAKAENAKEELKSRISDISSTSIIQRNGPARPSTALSTSSRSPSFASNNAYFTPNEEAGEFDLNREDIEETASVLTTPKPANGGFHFQNGTVSRSASSAFNDDMDLIERLRDELTHLQQEHSLTLSELNAYSNKYAESLKEISSLHDQLKETRLVNGEAGDTLLSSPRPVSTPDKSDSASDTDTTSKALTSSPTANKTSPVSRRGGKRDAVSMGHGTSSSISSSSTTNSREFFQSRGAGESRRTRPMSLFTELSSLPSSRSSWAGQGTSLLSSSTSPNRLSPSSSNAALARTSQSYEQEIMSLQQVLKSREEEIDALERSLSQLNKSSVSPGSRRSPSMAVLSPSLPPTDGIGLQTNVNGDIGELAIPEQDRPPKGTLSPHTLGNFDAFRESISELPSPNPEANAEHLHRLDELMRSMAQKESSHRETVESLNNQIRKVQREHNTLQALSRDQALNMSGELDGLRNSLRGAEDKHDDLNSQLEHLRRREMDLQLSLQRQSDDQAGIISKLKTSHDEALQRKENDSISALSRLSQSHEASLKVLEIERKGILSNSNEDHVSTINSLREEHNKHLSNLESQFAADFDKSKTEHAAQLKAGIQDSAELVSRLKADHELTLARITQEKDSDLERLRATLAKSREEHVTTLHQVRQQSEKELQNILDKQQRTLLDLNASHDAALEESRDQVMRLKEDHFATLQTVTDDHTKQMDAMTASHASSFQAMAVERDLLTRQLEDNKSGIVEKNSEVGSAAETAFAATAINTELADSTSAHTAEVATLQSELKETLEIISSLEQAVAESNAENGRLQNQCAELRTQLDSQRSNKLEGGSEVFQSTSYHDMQQEIESLHSERLQQDQIMRELQIRLSEVSSSSVDSNTSPTMTNGSTNNRESVRSITGVNRAGSPSGGKPKPPPPTPPPSMPVPPIPSSLPPVPSPIPEDGPQQRLHRVSSTSSQSGSLRSSAISTTTPETAKLVSQIEEQDQTIKGLNKRLQHCEADLQANIDLVNTLEAALNDSERALRKSRLSANDIAKERDRMTAEAETLRGLLSHARAEVLTVKSSVNTEKGELETRLSEERRQKDTARRELEERMDEIQRRKSKFNCF